MHRRVRSRHRGTAALDDLQTGSNMGTQESYLQNILQRIADHPISKVDELLSWNVLGASAVTANGRLRSATSMGKKFPQSREI